MYRCSWQLPDIYLSRIQLDSSALATNISRTLQKEYIAFRLTTFPARWFADTTRIVCILQSLSCVTSLFGWIIKAVSLNRTSMMCTAKATKYHSASKLHRIQNLKIYLHRVYVFSSYHSDPIRIYINIYILLHKHKYRI